LALALTQNLPGSTVKAKVVFEETTLRHQAAPGSIRNTSFSSGKSVSSRMR
jgi:hypothetical protein